MSEQARPVAAKLQIKPGYQLWMLGTDNSALIDPLPTGVSVVSETPPTAPDAAILVTKDRASLDALLPQLEPARASASVWICYPKGNVTDINRDSIWTVAEAHGWKLVSNVPVDETWSAVRLKPELR